MRRRLAQPRQPHRLLHHTKPALLRLAVSLDSLLLSKNPHLPEGQLWVPQTNDKVLIAKRSSRRPHETNPTKRESTTRAHACGCRVLRDHAAVHRVSSCVRVHEYGSLSLHAYVVLRVHYKRPRKFLGKSFDIYNCKSRIPAFVYAFFGLEEKAVTRWKFDLAKIDAVSKDKRIFWYLE